MFTSSTAFPVFDHLRVPYVVERSEAPGPRVPAVGRLRATASPDARHLLWAQGSRLPGGARFRGVFEVAGCRLAGPVATARPERLLPDTDPSWTPVHDVVDLSGRRVAQVATNARGDVFLPFDPGEVMQCLWSEGYRTLDRASQARAAVRTAAVRGYYAVRPALPRNVQLSLRRRLARRPQAPAFPRWPLETGLHDMYEWLLGLCSDLAGAPVPWIAPWPDGNQWCLVLTHDVETAQGRADIPLLRAAERTAGFRSSWNFVPERYETPARTTQALWDEGCEVGVHGLRHDGRDLVSMRVLRGRLPAIRQAALRWGATGFRSPATQRHWSMMPRLGFDYDSSYTDTDPYEPQPGGCCTYLPFFIEDLVELPITLPQDHTLFAVLGHRDGNLWVEKARELRDRGGLVLALSHPDYAHGAALSAWHQLLEELAGEPDMWQPLPRDVAVWWRDRARSRLVASEDGWRVVGPAAGRAWVRQVLPESVGQDSS